MMTNESCIDLLKVEEKKRRKEKNNRKLNEEIYVVSYIKKVMVFRRKKVVEN